MQKVRIAEEIIMKLRKIGISVNHRKSIRLSCREEGIILTTNGGKITEVSVWIKPKS